MEQGWVVEGGGTHMIIVRIILRQAVTRISMMIGSGVMLINIST